ncbi:MAG: hypothetical protein ACRENW_04505 [Thermodesulfobacteriota bacterium]
MSRYAMVRAIAKWEPATVQSTYDEVGEKDADGDSILEDLVAFVSEGLVEEQKEGKGIFTYVFTVSGKKALEAPDN